MTIRSALESYLKQLAQSGAVSSKVIKPLADSNELAVLQSLQGVTVPEELKAYLTLVDGYDSNKCQTLDVFEPEFAWGMFPIAIKQIPGHYETCFFVSDEDPDYWPKGFVPIMWGGSGDYLVVNCIPCSPTFGAVYDMTEGVGCNRVADSLSSFFNACTQVLSSGLRRFEEPGHSTIPDPKAYLTAGINLFGDTPYFRRVGKMGSQIIDWH